MGKIVEVTDSIVLGVEPSEKPEDTDSEPFLLRKRSQQEIADYDAGFAAGSKGGASEEGKSDAWNRGWAEAQE
jgi:hypothetical protein